ncbi:MAG: RNA methyltransferase [Christensenellaceae bacterium]|jgi:TrmH family RNA methyltransferase|nr:RNA methyltransferase [Christensenellaceae bacterium]
MDKLSSAKNPIVSKLRALKSKEGRDEFDEYLVEGGIIVTDMPKKMIKQLFVREDSIQKYQTLIDTMTSDVYVLKDSIFKVISDTETSSGIVAVAARKIPTDISHLRPVIVLDEIRDAGNMGTIIRSVVAFGVYDIIAINCVDHYNPKVVRASMGGIFHSNIVNLCDSKKLKKILNDHLIIGLDSRGSNIYDFNPDCNWALIIGSEAHGISSEARSIVDKLLAIPMLSGKIESLNAAVSAAIATSWFCNSKII